MKKLLITKNLVVKIQDLVVNQESRHVKSNPDVDQSLLHSSKFNCPMVAASSSWQHAA